MIIIHKQAIIDRLNTDSVLASCGHEGVVLPDSSGKRPERYWTLFTDSGSRFTDRLAGLQTQATFRYRFHWVASEPEQAQRLAERGLALLIGWRPTVDGYAPFPMRHIESMPTQLDDDVRPPAYFGVDVLDLSTQPA